MSLYGALKGAGPNGFGYGSTAEDVTRGLQLDGKTILVTGCASGLGLETMRVLALRGARVLGTARTVARASAACDAAGGGRSVPLACELADPTSIRACVAEVKRLGARLDAVVCNAGIMALPRREVAHGIELQLFTNHFGHFILVTGLLEQLAEDGRVVVVSSTAHRRAPTGGISFDDLGAEHGYSPWTAYAQSKFANILFAKELARQFAGTRRVANALHPGVIHTDLVRHLPAIAGPALSLAAPLVLKTTAEGAATQVYLAVHPGAAEFSGAYFADCNVAAPRPDANDRALSARLWEISAGIAAKLSG